MVLARQIWTLTRKNLLIVLWRHFLSTTFRALILPIAFLFFISYAKNFFIPPAEFGIGSPSPVRSLSNALTTAGGGHDTVAFVNNGFTNGDIGNIIEQLSQTIRAAGLDVQVVEDETDLLTVCRSSLRGATRCYAAANFHSSPTEGTGGIWNYTTHYDGSLGTKVFVNHNNNDQEIYVLPFQRAIDDLIANSSGKTLPTTVEEYPYTYETNEQRARNIVRLYQGTVISILAVAFFLGMVGITYQLVGHMATEREVGMSQLLEAMMPNKRRWEPQLARILSYHLAFDLIYVPSWVIGGALVSGLVFPDTSQAIVICYHLLAGLALASYSIFFGSFFRKSQLSGITTTIVSIVLAIIAQVAIGGKGSTGAIAVLSLLFPPMNYVFFLIMTAKFQQINRPMNLIESPPNSAWQISGIVLWIFLIVQIIVFPILAALVERARYGTASTDRKLYDSADPSGASIAVKLTNFNKIYEPGKFKRFFSFGRKPNQQVHAVKDLSLDILQGQIAVLLGANGCGKSTTLDAIAGLHPATSGTIEVDGRGGLGLCPQKNVLWDDVTVYEHVRIFNSLKSIGGISSKNEHQSLIADCDLAMKENAKSKTLSGGQKRKLQLAMMFTGGSKVCCIDEVSSGIDPLARRKVWDILLAERGRRTLLLCTHYLDEADVLSDHIAMMSKGVLKAEGSAVELKNKLGGGYRVFVDSTGYEPEPQFASVSRYLDYDQAVYQLSDFKKVSQFIASLDRTTNVQYRVQSPTIEDVFLKMADELKDDNAGNLALARGPVDEDDSEAKSPDDTNPQATTLNLRTGRGTTLFQQLWILFKKRFAVLRYNYLPYCAAIIIPVITAGLVTMFLQGFAGLGCSPTDSVSIQQSFDLSSFDVDLVYGPPNLVSVEDLSLLYPDLDTASLHPVNTLDEFNAYISNNYANVTPGGFFLNDNGQQPVMAYIANYQIAFSSLVLNLLDVVETGLPVTTQVQSFSIPWAPGAGDTLQLILYFGLAMCAYPGFFALYPTAERLRKVRALHYSNGVRGAPLWSAYILFDFLFVLLVSVIVVVLFTALWHHWYYPGYLFVVLFLYGLTSTAFSYAISLFVPSQLAAFAFAAGTQAIFFLIYLVAYLCIITYVPANATDHNLLVANFIVSIFAPAPSLIRALFITLNEFSATCHGFELAGYPGDITVYGGPILYLIVQFLVLMTFVVWWDSGGRFTLFRRTAHRTRDIEISSEQDAEVIHEVKRVEASDDSLRVLHLTKAFGSNVAVDDVSFGIKKGECFALLGPNGAGKSTTITLVRGDMRPSRKSGGIIVEDVSLESHRNAARNHLGVCPQFDAMDVMTVRDHLRFYARVRGVPEIDHNVTQIMEAVGITQYANRMALTLSGGNKRKLSLAIALMGNPSVVLLDEPSSGMDAAARRTMWFVLKKVVAGRALLITTHSMEEADALASRAGIMARRMLAIGTTDQLRKSHGDAHHVHLVHEAAPHTSDTDMTRIKQWVRRSIPGAQVEDWTYHGQLRFFVPNSDSSASGLSPNMLATSSSSSTSPAESSVDLVGPTVKPDPFSQGRSQGHSVRALFDLLESRKEELGIAYYSVSPTTLDQVFLNVVRKHNVEEENSHVGEGKSKRRWWRRFFSSSRNEKKEVESRPPSYENRDSSLTEVVLQDDVGEEAGKGGVGMRTEAL